MKLRLGFLDHKGLIALFCVVFLSTLLILEQTNYRDILSADDSAVHSSGAKKLIVFPSTFRGPKTPKALLEYYKLNLDENEKFDKPSEVFKYNQGPSSLSKNLKRAEFHESELNVFDLHTDNCEQNVRELKMEITASSTIDTQLEYMVGVLERQLNSDPAFEELKPYFPDIHKQVVEGTLSKYWYRFSGSSVWLKDHGVHFVITRAEYTTGVKVKPIMSLAYAQIFDRDWKELKDISLVVHTVDDKEEPQLESIQFPKFLPVPFYHDISHMHKRYYGPEDPRTFLVQSEVGEEPVIIVNAHHRKVDNGKQVDELNSQVRYSMHRSMFLVWPFRYQRGKLNVNGISDQYDEVIYNKVVELKRSNTPRLETQKNWTPMLSYDHRQIHGYDKYIYFVYRWSQLEVLKCNLDNFHQGVSDCDFVYKRMDDSSKEDVGPLRGGTEMINLLDIIPNKDLIDNPHKEIWVGFPRAHLKKCGCGRDLYRPNLAVVTREGDNFKVSQLSSFVSLDMRVYGWSAPEKVCDMNEANVLISNGVSAWEYDGADDYLTLTVSVADEYNYVIHFKNLMKLLLKQTDLTKFDLSAGYGENIINCAIKKSEQFCRVYGKEIEGMNQ